MKLSEAQEGRKVVYTPFKECNPKDKEEGVITSFNSKFIFVRYDSDYGSKATRPEDLEYIGGTSK